MTPEAILRKEAFRRNKPSAVLTEMGQNRYGGSFYTSYNETYDPLKYEFLTQADFLREFDPNSHNINSIKYYPNQLLKDANSNKIHRKVKSRVAIAWQKRIFTQRLATLTGNNLALSIANAETGKGTKDILRLFREGWVVKDMENAVYEAISSNGKTGDCALCFFKDNGEIGWKSFSFDKGDILYPHYDPITGRLAVFGRRYGMFTETDVEEYLDVWDDKYYARYHFGRQDGKTRGKKEWILDQPATPHGFTRIPIAYDRYGEPFWAASQSLIDAHELAMSQLAENNAAYALRILVLMGAEMDMESSIDGTPTMINSTDVNAKASFLEPSDSSASFELQLKTLEKNIMRCSHCVETPEVKGSDLSSLTVKMLFADVYQKALDDAQHFQPFLNDVVAIFKEGYGAEIGRISDFTVLKVKAEILPYYFLSETEVVNSLVQLKGSGILSKRSASGIAYEQLGYGDIDEADIVLQEAHDELVLEAETTIPEENVNEVNNARNEQQ